MKHSISVLVVVFGLHSIAAAQVKIDEKLPEYVPGAPVAGSIKSVGSDTMNNMMTLWSESFRKYYPNVKIEIEGKGRER